MTTKTYTNSELFTLANQIRRSTGCSKSEAYYKAKTQLENPNKVHGTRSKCNGIKITDKVSNLVLKRHNLHVNEVYTSVKALAIHMNTSVQNVYEYIYLGMFVKM